MIEHSTFDFCILQVVLYKSLILKRLFSVATSQYNRYETSIGPMFEEKLVVKSNLVSMQSEACVVVQVHGIAIMTSSTPTLNPEP
jgi:hypothetical protein